MRHRLGLDCGEHGSPYNGGDESSAVGCERTATHRDHGCRRGSWVKGAPRFISTPLAGWEMRQVARKYICESCGKVSSTSASPHCCGHSMRRLELDHYFRVCHWTKQRRLDWLAQGGPDRQPDDPRAVAATFLQQHSCPTCSWSFVNVRGADLSRGHTPKYRCPPPHPTCWQIRCPRCSAWINLAVRFDKVWPEAGSTVPVRRRT